MGKSRAEGEITYFERYPGDMSRSKTYTGLHLRDRLCEVPSGIKRNALAAMDSDLTRAAAIPCAALGVVAAVALDVLIWVTILKEVDGNHPFLTMMLICNMMQSNNGCGMIVGVLAGGFVAFVIAGLLGAVYGLFEGLLIGLTSPNSKYENKSSNVGASSLLQQDREGLTPPPPYSEEDLDHVGGGHRRY